MEIDDYIVADDAQLAALVLQGDQAAFGYLFDRYREAIYRLFVQRAGDKSDADDLLQETFIKVYMNIDRYSPDYTFGQWVYTIARNTLIDYLRRRSDDVSIDERFLSPVSPGPTPEESVIDAQRRTQFEAGLSRLTPAYRQLIVMRFIEERSYEEIAESRGRGMNTIKTQIRRAKEAMCRLIVEHEE